MASEFADWKCLASSLNSNLCENRDLREDGHTSLPTNWLVSIGNIDYLAQSAGNRQLIIIEPNSP